MSVGEWHRDIWPRYLHSAQCHVLLPVSTRSIGYGTWTELLDVLPACAIVAVNWGRFAFVHGRKGHQNI